MSSVRCVSRPISVGVRAARRVMTAGVLTLLAACTPWATYPSEGTAGIDNPGLAPMPQIMGEALEYVHTRDEERYGSAGELIFNLPEGTAAPVYDRVIKDLNGDARPMVDPNEEAYHVRAVRLRTTKAEVDIIHPGTKGTPELVTVYLHQEGFSGFRVTDEHVWRFYVRAPEPNYPAARAAMEKQAGQGDWGGKGWHQPAKPAPAQEAAEDRSAAGGTEYPEE